MGSEELSQTETLLSWEEGEEGSVRAILRKGGGEGGGKEGEERFLEREGSRKEESAMARGMETAASSKSRRRRRYGYGDGDDAGLMKATTPEWSGEEGRQAKRSVKPGGKVWCFFMIKGSVQLRRK